MTLSAPGNQGPVSSRLRHRRVTDRSGSTVAGIPRPGSPKDRQPLKGDATPQTAGWPRTPQTCGTPHPRVQGWGQASASVEWGMGFGWPWRLPDLCPGPDSWPRTVREAWPSSPASPLRNPASPGLELQTAGGRRDRAEANLQSDVSAEAEPLSNPRGARAHAHAPARTCSRAGLPSPGGCDSGGRLLTSSLS